MNLTDLPPSLNSQGLSDFFFLWVFSLLDGSRDVSEEEDSEVDVEDEEVVEDSCCRLLLLVRDPLFLFLLDSGWASICAGGLGTS